MRPKRRICWWACQNLIAKKDPQHHRFEISIINQLNVDFVSDFPLDTMHLVCLGVMKMLSIRLKSIKRHEN